MQIMSGKKVGILTGAYSMVEARLSQHYSTLQEKASARYTEK